MDNDAASNINNVRLVDVEVTSETVALNLLVSFCSLAQKRGVYSIDESAKIWECVKKFQRSSGSGSDSNLNTITNA